MNKFIIYANIDHSGWAILQKTPDREKLEHILRTIMGVKENVSVIVVYRTKEYDVPLCSFNNKVNKDLNFDKMLKWAK